jgi:hypothetical protein
MGSIKNGKGEKEAAWATLRQARNQLIQRNLDEQLAVMPVKRSLE